MPFCGRCCLCIVLAGISVLGLSATAHGQRPLGMDISVWQGAITPDQWAQTCQAGKTFAFIKSSQATNITDSRFYANIANAPNAGLYVGPYHFADPENYSAVAEANYFVSVAGAYMAPGYIRPVLDLEWGSGLGKTALSTWANDFCNRVVTLKGVRPIIYTGWSFANTYLNSSVTQWDLWLAAWWTNPNPQTDSPIPAVWSNWTFWQYTSSGSVPGLSGNIDLDVFHGTFAQFASIALIPGTQIVRAPTSLTTSVMFGSSAPSQSIVLSRGGSGVLVYSAQSNVAWATVTPTAGGCTSEQDTLTVSYSIGSLSPGTYNGTITITSGAASNSPLAIPVTMNIIAIPGDMDMDGDLDITDTTLFANCRTAPTVPQTDPNCLSADIDDDLDVDQSDFGLLQKCLSGPTVAADPNCPVP